MMWFEWKKIFERRLNVTAMLVGYILIGVCVFSYISQETFYDEETKSYIKGIDAVHREQARAAGQTDVITEEYVTQLVSGIQSQGIDLESDEAYTQIIRPLGDIFYFTARNYTDMRKNTLDISALGELDLTDGAQFYAHRMKKITDYLNCDFSFGNYTEAEKEYWIRKAEGTNIPFRWGSGTVMSYVWELVNLGFYLCLVIVICTSSVFSAEYESGAASLLLTTKYGKDRMIWAKIGTAVLFSAGYLIIGILAAAGVIALLFGLPGADLPVQLWNSVIPYNLTVGQACVGTLALILLIGMTIALVLLACSARLRSSLTTLVVGVVIIIAPTFFPMSKESGLWNHINNLFPVRLMDFRKVIGSYVSYAAGSHVISYVQMGVIVYVVIGAAALLLTRTAVRQS